MRIVAISDTHLIDFIRGEPVTVPDGDVLVHCGDATNHGTYEECGLFATRFAALPHKHKVFVPGNHDIGFQEAYERGELGSVDWAHILIDSEVVIDGVKFWGSPWQPEFFDWAWNLPRGPELKKHWDLIPADTRVLVTHSPPLGMGDRVWRHEWKRDQKTGEMKVHRFREHVGCADLMEAVRRVKPKLHLFGHIHSDYGRTSLTGLDTMFMNCALADERYHIVNKPQVFDL